MALSRSEFEKLIASDEYVGTRNKATRVATLIQTNLQGTSHEAFMALLPKLQNSSDVPSTSVAKAVLVLAEQWLGNAAVENTAPLSLTKAAPSDRERYVAMTAKVLLATGDFEDEAVALEIAEMGYDYFILQDSAAVRTRVVHHALTKSVDRLRKAATDFGAI